MSNFIFNTGAGQSGLAAFQQNFLKVCIEDKDFFNENWENITPNDWADTDVRAMLYHCKSLKINGIEVSYDNLKVYIENIVEGFDKLLFMDTLDTLKNDVVLNEEETKKIKETYMYFGLYASMLSQANMIFDWAKSGFKFGNQVVDMYEKMQIGMEKNNALYNRLLSVIGESNLSKDDNSWNE